MEQSTWTISRGDKEKDEREEWSSNMPEGLSRSLILMARPMSDGTRYNTLMNSRSILAHSNVKSIFNYPSAFDNRRISVNLKLDIFTLES